MKSMTKPLVAIIGRPNVGKSTLFNRLVGRREAVVTNIPGTTRDRILADVYWDDLTFTVVDTGGLEPPSEDPLKGKVRAQVETAMDEADLLIFLVDGVEGLNPIDQEIAQQIRLREKPVITVVNKVDNQQRELSAAEFYRLGMKDLLYISAYHNLGIHDLMDRTAALLPPTEVEEEEVGVPRIAILGRTNVGKSLLLNAILGEERAIVSEIAGTTRDSLDTRFDFDGSPMVLVDTAGIRRRGQVRQGIERYSVMRAFRAIQRCDVAFMVMDATEVATAQDAHVFGYAADSFKGMIAVINKWDLVPNEDGTEKEHALWAVRRRFHFMPYVPAAFTSALKNEGIGDLLRLALDVYQERQRTIPPKRLSSVLFDALADQPPASTGTRQVTIRGIRQVDVNPPTFVFSVNDPKVHFSYRRYLENRIRTAFDFRHTHLRLVFKRTK
jgi:GTP-binding protein